MWCRFFEVAHGFRDEMGHATFGHGEKFSKVRSARRTEYQGSEPKQKVPTFGSSRRRRGEEEDDEIELAPTHTTAHNNTKVES
ncbi:hypothetical protein LTR53_020255, partial [Teratosphaeriaceae sp. CCFEE 6253]